MRFAASLLSACLVLPVALAAQGGAPPAGMPKVGDVAPDFTLTAATNAGIATKPVTLSSLKGRTVVIAFFPRQRSSGCTIQMQAYRDKYDQLFHSGKDVTLLGVSTDSAKDLYSWAAEAHFQFTFLADVNGDAGMKYATYRRPEATSSAYVYVVAPNGKISYVMKPFNPRSMRPPTRPSARPSTTPRG